MSSKGSNSFLHVGIFMCWRSRELRLLVSERIKEQRGNNKWVSWLICGVKSGIRVQTSSLKFIPVLFEAKIHPNEKKNKKTETWAVKPGGAWGAQICYPSAFHCLSLSQLSHFTQKAASASKRFMKWWWWSLLLFCSTYQGGQNLPCNPNAHPHTHTHTDTNSSTQPPAQDLLGRRKSSEAHSYGALSHP